MSDAIISPNDIANSSGSPAQRFISLSMIADRRLSQLLQEVGSDSDTLKYQYMSQLEAIAEALGISGLAPSDTPPISESRWKQFRGSVHAARTRAALAESGPNRDRTDFIALSLSAEARIRSAIANLRELIQESTISEKKKARLFRKLGDLERAVNDDRVSISAALKTMALIATIFGGTATGLAKSPEAVETIYEVIQLLGEEEESRETLRLEAPRRLLPPPDEVENESDHDAEEIA